MEIQKRINAFDNLRAYLEMFLEDKNDDSLLKKLQEAQVYNGWFTEENCLNALKGITILLDHKNLEEAAKQIIEPSAPKTVAIIMAGNIPCVGFHDLMCVLLSGNKALLKLSGDDKILIPFLLEKLTSINPAFSEYISYSENKLARFDAVIATGSNSSAAYFNHYFGKYPHIIRKNRNSIAVLSGNETADELKLLGKDIFTYYGLGCRNVSKLFVPENYSFDYFFESIFSFSYVLDNKKYANNYEYNRAIYLMAQEKFLDNNFLIVKRNEEASSSPVGVLYYDYYKNNEELENKLNHTTNETQCIASNTQYDKFKCIALGETQNPGFFDYADEVNTLDFLNTLK